MKHLKDSGVPVMAIQFVDGKPAGPTATYLGANFISGPDPVLKGVIAVGGGPIALEEVKYANEYGIPVKYVRAEARYPEVNGQYGSVDEWTRNQKSKRRLIVRSCKDLLSGK